MSYLFFATSGAQDAPTEPGEEYTVFLWRPTWLQPVPPGHSGIAFRARAAFHLLHLFGNRDYGALLIYTGGALVHRSCLIPPCFRFPFMGPNDLLIGDAWTHPDQCERELAAFALRYLIKAGRKPGRTFWHVVDEANAAAICAVEKAGFRRIGRGEKIRPLGLNLFAAYTI